MKNGLWGVLVIVAGFIGFLIGYAQQQPPCGDKVAARVEAPQR